MNHGYLVGALEHEFFDFPFSWEYHHPTDELHDFSEGLKPPPVHILYIYIWVNYSDLTVTSLEIIVSKGNHPQMALIQVSEIL